jgi:hypothetical protein
MVSACHPVGRMAGGGSPDHQDPAGWRYIMSLVRRSGFGDILSLRQAMDRLF